MSHQPRERDLDPVDWESFRRLGHRMLDDMLDYLRTVRERPAWQPVPASVSARLDEPLPQDPTPAEDVYRTFRENVLPYPTGNIHPRFWGWVMGNGTPDAMLAEMLASGLNPNVPGFDQGAAVIERQVTRWLLSMMGFHGGSGILVSGGTVATLVALAVARHAKAGFDVDGEGVQAPGAPRLMIYGSSETHRCVPEACQVLGLGRAAFRAVAVDERYRIDERALRARIAADREAGCTPICVVGNAGTVNTGATDDLDALASVCRDEGLWFHVDGAFGALAVLSPRLRPALHGSNLADSLAFDLHKWGYLPYEIGCALFRDPTTHRDTFAREAAYLQRMDRGIAKGSTEFAGRGVQLSRGFRALKVWMALKIHGVRAWQRQIEQNVAQAAYLAERVRTHPDLELLAPAELNIVCLRYRALPAGTDPNAANQEILLRIQESGVAVPSSTVLGGAFALRVAITNHRTRREDLDLFVDAVLRFGAEVASTAAGG
jgi:glutamate/tyrosine decarboxylase-like PLP-dependent enzyme